ncbi:hypothetical protein BpHYR1_017119 [Brachionus plicatilis]|uniref:Uncharacterized protein n=1 Tax=Brachionus plicatilis TaxID=10195 RepID=A0A3M7S6M1_BRAPC|nr:hypothetical protein BpHYR1_017119 [Brachionus plicatilis]
MFFIWKRIECVVENLICGCFIKSVILGKSSKYLYKIWLNLLTTFAVSLLVPIRARFSLFFCFSPTVIFTYFFCCINPGDDSFSIALAEPSSKLASRRLSQLDAFKQPISTSYVLSTSVDSSSFSLGDESTIKNSPGIWPQCSGSASNKVTSGQTANRNPRSTSVPFRTSNGHLVDKQSASNANTYVRKRSTIPPKFVLKIVSVDTFNKISNFEAGFIDTI